MLPILENAHSSCGSCTACCTVMHVPVLKKESHQDCLHQCSSGCNIYKSRPSECREYKCFWISHTDNLNLRPDKLGVILEISDTKIGRAVIVREVRKDASQSHMAQEFVNLVSERIKRFVYIFKTDASKNVVFPKWAKKAQTKFLEKVS